MRLIVLYEFTSSGGLWQQGGNFNAADSLVREGRAMLTALAADFEAIDGLQPMVLKDSRWTGDDFEGCMVCEVNSAANERSLLSDLAAKATAAVVIAPETDGILSQRCRWIEDAGGWLLGPSTEVVVLAADKQRTAEHLASRGVSTPRGIIVRSGEMLPYDFRYPAVLKPIDGCGSQDMRLLAPSSRMAAAVLQLQSARRLEEFKPGAPASVAVLCGPNELRPLAACHQWLSRDGRFQYLGGSLPLTAHMAERAQQLAVRAVATLPEPRGYIGVDLVLGDDPGGGGDVVIEINPRLTTSYIGLRTAAKCNLAEAMWAIAEGRSAEVSFGDERIEFDSDGTVRCFA